MKSFTLIEQMGFFLDTGYRVKEITQSVLHRRTTVHFISNQGEGRFIVYDNGYGFLTASCESTGYKSGLWGQDEVLWKQAMDAFRESHLAALQL